MTARRISIYNIITLAILVATMAVYSLPQKSTANATNTNGVEEDIDIDIDTNIIIQNRHRKMKTLSNKPPDTTKIAVAGKPTTADLLPVKHRRAKSSKRGKRSKKHINLFGEDCDMGVFKGQYLYTNGCGGKSFAVDIACDLDSNDKRQRCVYKEYSVCCFNSLMSI